MKSTLLSPLTLVLATCAALPDDDDGLPGVPGEPPIRVEDVMAHVEWLASDELAGRHAQSDEARRAARYLAKCFARYGLEPFGDGGTWFQSIGEEFAPNVVGLLRGTGPGYVVLSAHYDHLRPKPAKEGEPDDVDRIFNGADDNASGTAAVLELAHAFAATKEKPGRSLVFVAFTAEEGGLRGSRYFVEHPPVPLDQLVGNVNLDMVGRGEEDLIFCEPGDGSDALLAAALAANRRLGELRMRVGEHREWLRQSDHWAFLSKGVPAIYFGVEDHPDYHRVGDHADKLLPELTVRVARLVEALVRAL